MKNFFKLFSSFFRVAIRREMAYRGTYLAGIFGQWICYGSMFLSLYIVVSSFNLQGEWNGAEVMVLYGLSLMSYAIGASLFFNFSSQLSQRIRSGEFDASLTKPIHPFLHEVFSAGCNVGYVSHFTIALIIIVISLSHLHYVPSPQNILLFILMVTGASLVQAASLIASSTMSFFTIGSNPIMDFLLWDVKQFVNYPITIFPKGIQFILTFLLPFAFINFYPVSALLHKSIPKGYPAILPMLSPAVGALLFVLSILLWNWGLKHYKSTGS